MSAIARGSGAVLAMLLFASVSFSWEYAYAVTKCPIPSAPDACGPGWYSANCYGMVYGPNYWLYPPCMPFNGYLPGQKGEALMVARAGVPPWAPAAARTGALQAQGFGPGSIPGVPARMPQAPGYPPGTPMAPGYPGVPGTPMAPGYPPAPGVPGYPNAPGVPGTPMAPGYPNAPGVPGAPYPPGTPLPPGTPYPPTNLPYPPTPPGHPERAQIGTYPVHPYVRGPRDFFMWNEYLEDVRGRDVRPYAYQQ
jgi:hypothetical protein